MRQGKLIIGNWKMNGTLKDVAAFTDALIADALFPDARLIICPPFTLLSAFAAALGSGDVALGAQNCAVEVTGEPATGDISAAQLVDLSCRYVIVGHSERRARAGETNATVRAKAIAAQQAGLTPIICIGDTLEQKQDEHAETAVLQQLAGSVPDGGDYIIAYEPVWAISDGTNGQPAQLHDIAGMHAVIRAKLDARYPLIYGGSVKADNAGRIAALDNVDGFLVGGASLQAASFLAIAKATANLL